MRNPEGKIKRSKRLYLSKSHGTPLAIIHGGKHNGEIIYLLDPDIHEEEDGIHLREFHHRDSQFFHYPKWDEGVTFASGAQDCGKSTYIFRKIMGILEQNPGKEVFLFTDNIVKPEKDKKPILNEIPGLQRIVIDESWIPPKPSRAKNKPIEPFSPLTAEQFSDSICIFDDIDSLALPIRREVERLRDSMSQVGCHLGIILFVTNHIANAGTHTCNLVAAAKDFVVFPGQGAFSQTYNLLKNHTGLSNPQINEICELDSRWVSINLKYGSYVMYDKGIYLL